MSTAANRDSNAELTARPRAVYQMATVAGAVAPIVDWEDSCKYCSVVAATLARNTAEYDFTQPACDE